MEGEKRGMLINYLKIIFCIIILLLVYGLGRKLCNKDILSPSNLNALAFIPSLVLLLFYVVKWEVNLDSTTVLLITLGPLIFLAISILFKSYKSKQFVKNGHNKIENIHQINVLVMTFVEIIALLLLFKYMVSFVGSFTNISALMLSYRYKSDYITKADLPTITSLFRLVSVYSGYIWAYLLSLNLIDKRSKNIKLYIINYVLSILVSLTSGARGTAIMLIISFIVQFLLLFSQKRKILSVKKETNKKYKNSIFFIFVIVIIIGTQFDRFANLLGRDTSDFTGLYYLAIYLSAPIKNLDIFIRDGSLGFAKNFWDNHTLSILTEYIGTKYFHISTPGFIYSFNTVNGYNLGNVSTAYANFYYDLGLTSYIIAIVFMAILSNIIYKKSIQPFSNYHSGINVYVIAYSIMAFGILFNFFANEFYNSIINIDFIRGIISIILVKFFLEKVRFGNKRRVYNER